MGCQVNDGISWRQGGDANLSSPVSCPHPPVSSPRTNNTQITHNLEIYANIPTQSLIDIYVRELKLFYSTLVLSINKIEKFNWFKIEKFKMVDKSFFDRFVLTVNENHHNGLLATPRR